MPLFEDLRVVFLFSFICLTQCYLFHPNYNLHRSSHTVLLNFNGLVQYVDDAGTGIKHHRQKRQDDLPTPASEITTEDNHNYYTSMYHQNGDEYYIDLDTEETSFTTLTHRGLSTTHLTAGEVELPFVFSFYGHNVTEALIATGGFLYVGTFTHEFLTATQYVAPLMGNFDPSANDSSVIRYANNGTAFTVEWSQVHVSHKKNIGQFTFQTTLMKDGRIIFAYKQVPAQVDSIGGGNGHKVTVGMSDGFYIDEPLYEGSTLKKRTIYKYHEILMNTTLVRSNSAFIFSPLTTCNQLTTCSMCLSKRDEISFDCEWCQDLRRCSSGFDRHRNEWVNNGCDRNAISDNCPSNTGDERPSTKFPATGVIIIVIVIFLSLVFLIAAAWAYYAYKYPNTPSGLLLITINSAFRGHFSRSSDKEDRYTVNIHEDSQPSEPNLNSISGNDTTPVKDTTMTVSEA